MHTWFSLFTAVTRATHFYLMEATRAARFRRTGHFLLYNLYLCNYGICGVFEVL